MNATSTLNEPTLYPSAYMVLTDKGSVQHLQYLPYGEPYINQHPFGYSERFTFTGKERDEETGYSYFSARYLDHEILTSFLSVDRYAGKYPFISPYAYCTWNPIKLTDPTGDTIFNAYEQYKDVSKAIQRLEGILSTAETRAQRSAIKKDIRNLKDNNEKYKRVQGALDAFKDANPEEYSRINNLKCNGENVNVTIYASNDFQSSRKASGSTHPLFLLDKDDKVVGLKSIRITLYKKAFSMGYCGLPTLANEFGDAIFAAERSQYQYDNYKILKTQLEQYNTNYYYKEPSSKFSSDYEEYIVNPNRNKKPNPNDY